ncbi:MAG TPA: exonuclease SbcCD subunit D [Gammaproteobacteria bacterium]|nr:exonuclease SbcCD subunit D [Gammaproteobacteria bacterium]
MKFIHTSDWHIGRQFHNVSLLEDQQYVLKQIVAYISQASVDALVIAGDIYDRSVPPATAVALLDEVLNQICSKMAVPVIIIPGNHDSAERLSFASRQLSHAGLHIMADLDKVTEPVIIKSAKESICFYGIPYNDPEHVNDHYAIKLNSHDEAHAFLLDKIRSSLDENNLNVLVSHCFIDGGEASESERPLSIGGADRVSTGHFKGFDYVALGHLHGPQYRGEEYIRYSGSILKYSFSEQHHKKAVTLVETQGHQLKGVSQLALEPLRNMRVIEGEIETIIEQGKTDPHADDFLLVRLTDAHAILNAMGQLRKVYPNVLHLEKPGLMAINENHQLQREKLKLSELDMFCDFFNHVSGRDLTEEQQAGLEDVINMLHNREGALK